MEEKTLQRENESSPNQKELIEPNHEINGESRKFKARNVSL